MALVAHESSQIAEHAMAWARPLAALASPGPTLEGLRALAWAAQMELEIAKDLLDVARIATQQLRSTFVSVDPAAIARQAAALVAPRAQMAQVEVRTAIDEVDPVLGEPTRLAQLLVGMLGVSIEHAGAGGHVGLRVEALPEGVLIEIARSGPAWSRDEWEWSLDQLGDEPAVVAGACRTGMALFVARQLASLHGVPLASHPPAPGALARLALTVPFGRAGAPRSQR